MKIRRLSAVAVLTALLLSGCTSLSLNGHDILSPPRAAGDRADVQRMIEQDAGKGYELLYPASGDYKSGVIMIDLDHDGTDEAIALYASASGAKILAAQKQGDSYKSIGSSELHSANVSSLRFADIDANGVDEILISCDAGAPIASLSAYVAQGELTRLDIAQGFTDYLTGDFDGNAVQDVLLLRPATAEAAAMAELWVNDGGSFIMRSSCETDPSAASYPSLQFGGVGSGLQGAVADSVTADGKYSTQLLIYDAATAALTNPLFVSASYLSYARTSPLYSRDIDDDGVIEFPLCSLTAHSAKEDLSHVSALAQWCCYDPAGLTPKAKLTTVLCEPLGFMLKLGEDVATTVTARYDGENTFILHDLKYKGTEPQLGEALLTVKRYEAGSFNGDATPETVLYESGVDVYTYTAGENCPLNDSEIKSSFMMIE